MEKLRNQKLNKLFLYLEELKKNEMWKINERI